MTKREICERLVKMSSELLHVSLQWKLSTGYGRDHAKRAMELLEIAQALDPDIAVPEEKK